MEADSSLKGYPLAGGRIPILITLMRTSDLRPHEEVVPPDLHNLVKVLRDNPVLRHSIIVDHRTRIVLDGTHRLAAMRELKCNFIPSALVDYQDPRIIVERWFRLLTGASMHNFESECQTMEPRKKTHDECERGIADRIWYATIENNTKCLAFPVNNNNPYQMVQDSYKIEMIARGEGLKIAYQDHNTLETQNTNGLIMSTIKLEKSEVIETVNNGRLLPPKSTRHLVPSRPLGGGVPLEWLQDIDFEQAQSRFLDYLRSLKVRRLPEGSKVGSRRYLEEVFLFE